MSFDDLKSLVGCRVTGVTHNATTGTAWLLLDSGKMIRLSGEQMRHAVDSVAGHAGPKEDGKTEISF